MNFDTLKNTINELYIQYMYKEGSALNNLQW